MLLENLVATSARVGATHKRLEKIDLLADLLGRLGAGEIPIAVGFLCGEPRQGKVGVGPALVRQALASAAAVEATVTLAGADAALGELSAIVGRGAGADRRQRLAALMEQLTEPEQRFVAQLLIGEIRQGALEGLMADAIAKAAQVPAGDVRRALMLAADRGAVAAVALAEGVAGLARFDLVLGRPVQPMLAATAADVDQAIANLGHAAFEYKLDGARVQVHKAGDDVQVFTRNLNDVTAAVPEVVEAVRALPVASVILDGETLAVRPDGRPHPFQTTMKRFGRRLQVEQMRQQLPLATYFFDCLYADGRSVIDRPARERIEILETVGGSLAIPRTVTADPAVAQAFFTRALAAGHEGIMAKALDAGYEAGGRGRSWLKIKPAHTLDLVVLACEWGSGRRKGWLSNLHLGARDPSGFVMLGKTFKGLTDAMLRWQTERLLQLETARDGATVFVRPELVVEIAFNDVQTSPHYPGGLALRFARVKGYREDKSASDADTIDTVRGIHARSLE